jgi:type I restriction enzyme S subunit
MSSSIPEGWAEIKLGQIVKLQGGNAFKSSDFKEKGIPIVRISNIQNNIVDLSSAVYFEESKHFENFLISNGDILLAMSGATTGKIGRYRYPFKSYLNQRVGKFQIIKNSLIDFDFLNHLVHSNIFTKNTMIDAIGGAQPNISSTQVEGVFYRIPPLPEQKKIASILTSVDEVIEKTQKQIDKLQDFKKATMNELLTKGIGHTEFKDSELGKIPKSWATVGVSDVCKEIFLGLTSKVDYVDTGGFCLVRATDISKGVLDFSKAKQISKEQHQKLTKYRKAKKGDVLVSKSGSLGVCALVDTDTEFSIYESIIVMQSDEKILSSNFLLWFLRSSITQHQLLGDSVGSTVGHLNLGDFRRLKMILPLLDEQLEISNKISEIDKYLNLKNIKLSRIQSLKKSLMQDLFTGKVRVSVN